MIYKAKEKRKDIIAKWQGKWEEEPEKSQWTKRLIPNLAPG